MGVVDIEALPLIDEHGVDVEATAQAVWQAALATFQASLSSPLARTTARALGCDPSGSSSAGGPLVGSTVPGFQILTADRPHLLVLAGRDRFSRYAILLRVETLGRGSRCRLESRAEFPGAAGRLYRAAVIGSGGHVLAVRRLLRTIARTAEDAAPL